MKHMRARCCRCGHCFAEEYPNKCPLCEGKFFEPTEAQRLSNAIDNMPDDGSCEPTARLVKCLARFMLNQ